MPARKTSEALLPVRSAATGKFVNLEAQTSNCSTIIRENASAWDLPNLKVCAGSYVLFISGNCNNQKPWSSTEILRVMRDGAPSEVVPTVAYRLGITQDRLFEFLKLPKSTLKGRIRNKKPLARDETDRIYRVDRVMNRAIEVLGDENAAKEWITRENRSLGGDVPLTLMDTEYGYELVLDTLSRIEYGVFS